MEWFSNILAKLLEQRRIFAAIFLSGLSTLYMVWAGLIVDLREELSWVVMATTFGGWMTLINIAEAGWKNHNEKSLIRADAERMNAARAAKHEKHLSYLAVLDAEQRGTLAFLKHCNTQVFQASNNDSVLHGLVNIGLLMQGRSTSDYDRIYEVPPHVWDAIVLTQRDLELMRTEEPWRRRMRARRI